MQNQIPIEAKIFAQAEKKKSIKWVKLTPRRCSFVVRNFVIGKRQVGNVAVNGG